PAPRPGERERRTPGAPASKGWTRHPATLVAGALGLLVFGVVLGAGVSRFSEQSEPMAPPAGGRPASSPPAAVPGPMAGAEPGKPLPAEVLRGMLGAARQSLTEGRYSEAIAAYQAVLKRDPKNVDALTHLGLIVAIGGHADAALETFDKALAIDPRYAPAHLYRGEVLYEVKQDYPGAVRAWERYLELEPSGPERNRIVALVKEARSKPKPR
ncbi:MAG TPA: tetratricopeptide repeat protein, partial [Methylomirabilota bacterium]|nr:tetratricopeptide repeat protein [Methylomirabilota bacterium]